LYASLSILALEHTPTHYGNAIAVSSTIMIQRLVDTTLLGALSVVYSVAVSFLKWRKRTA